MFDGNDRAPARDLVADEFGRNEFRDRRAEALPAMLSGHELGQRDEHLFAEQVLADRDEFHLGRQDPAARVVHLRDVGAFARATRLAMEIEAHAGELRIGEPLASESGGRSGELDRVRAFGDPRGTQRRQALADVDLRGRIRVGTRRVVDDDRWILLGAERGRRVRLRDFAHRHPDVVARTRDEDLARVGQRGDGGRVDMRVARVEPVVGVHGGSSGRKARGAETNHASLRRHYPHRYQGCALTRRQTAPAGPLASDPTLRQSYREGNPRAGVNSPARSRRAGCAGLRCGS